MCDFCVPGSFAWSTMSTTCASCGVGTYQPHTMATSCVGCSTGAYQSSSTAGATTCIACSPGFYQPGMESTACLSCGVGSYQTAEGATFCVACPLGMHDDDPSGLSCARCPAGAYASTQGSSACVGCAPGTFQSAPGASSCGVCGPGSFQSQQEATLCDACQAGSYSTGEGMRFRQTCQSCAPGTFATGLGGTSGDYSTCLACGAGRFSTGAGQTSEAACTACPLGTFTSGDRSSCFPCPPDEFCPEGSAAPVPCRHDTLVCNGTHLDAVDGWLSVFLFGNCTDAMRCPSGTRCAQRIPGDKGLLLSRPETPAYFVVFEHGPFSVCDGGLTYDYMRVEQGRSSVDDGDIMIMFYLLPRGCERGYFLNGESCHPCPNGTYSITKGGLDPDTCIACGPGTFTSASGSTGCRSCAPGTYEPAFGMSACRQCLPGTFQSSAGGLECIECPFGSFSDGPGASRCGLCEAGSFQSERGQTRCSACNGSIEYSSEGDAACFPCGQPQPVPDTCEPAGYPENSEAIWVSVSGLNDDGCAAVLSDGSAEMEVHDAFHMYPGAVCRHTLRVLGRPELSPSEDWISEPSMTPLVSFAVLGYNQTFYPALCAREWFGVLVTTHAVNATFDVLDPTGKLLLFRGVCEPILLEPSLPIPMSRCHTMRFCPTMDVLVRVDLPLGVSSSVSLKAGSSPSVSCPPVSEWAAMLELRNPSTPFFPGDVLRIDFSVLNPPPIDQRLLAFRFALQVRSGFQFVAFTSSVPVKQEFVRGRLVVEGDISSSWADNPSLGQLVLLLDARHTGTLRAVRLEQDSFQFMVAQGSKQWFAVGVQAAGASCRRDGFVEVIVDYPRVTQLVVRARRTRLVHWQGVQAHASVFSTRVDVLGIWNNFAFPTFLDGAVCRSGSPRVLRVDSCSDIAPVGVGAGKVLVGFKNAPGQSITIHVSQPSSVSAMLGINNRLRVRATLYGHVLDISPYVLGLRTPVIPGGSISLHEDGMLSCNPGFVGNYTVGRPVLFRGECLPVPIWEPPRLSDTLFLFAGGWTMQGDYRLHPSMLTSDVDRAGLLFFRGGVLQPAVHAILESSDTSRAVVVEQREIRLVRHGQTPRCVSLGPFWRVPVVPPAPASLHVELTSNTLVVQQDMWHLVPSRSSLASAMLRFTDGSSMDVGGRLVWHVDSDYLEVLPLGGGVKALTRDGTTNISFSLADFPCVRADIAIQIFVSSVVTTTLVCQKCPEQLVQQADPLSLEWPFRFPSAIPASSFVVKRLLVDGSTHDQSDPLQVAGAGVLQGDQVVAVRSGGLSVSSAFARDPVTIPVIERSAVNYTILCNSRACNSRKLKLAPPRDGASMPPFRYATRLELGLELTMFDGSVSRFSWLPQVSILANGNTTTSLITALVPGPLDIQVLFTSDWQFGQSLVQFSSSLRVDRLDSLRLQVPPVLYQLHCTRLWQRGSVSVVAVLTDGMEADVRAGLVVDGQILRLDPTRAFVEVDWPGEGHVNASFGGMQATATVFASLESILFTSISLDSVPEQWTAPAGTRIPLHAMLFPLILIGSRKQSSYRLLLQRVIYWSVEPAGIVGLDEEEGTLVLLSDHYEPVRISALLRGCHMSTPISFSRSIQVNVAPDREGQVDLGSENGPPLPRVFFGDILAIPVYLFVSKPIQSYRVVLSLPGVELNNCTTGELPFGRCSPSGNEVSASFPASQRTGRLWVGTFSGRVRLNNTLSRLSVSVQSSSSGDSVSSFTVRIGTGRIQPTIPLVNTFVAGWTPGMEPATWPTVRPSRIQACCDLLAVGSGSLLTHLFPTNFRLRNLTVELTDPRIRVEYDELVLRLDTSAGVWTVEKDAQEFAESTSIRIHYTHPDTLDTLETSVSVTLAKQQEVLLQPTDALLLSSIHCSAGTFQTKQANASLLLRSGHVIPLSSAEDLANVTVSHKGVAIVTRGLAVTGLSVGNTSLILHALGMQASLAICVQTTSVRLVSVRMPDPYVLSSPRGGKRFLDLMGVLETGEVLSSLTFLNPRVTTDGPVLYQADTGSLVAQGNTHPSERRLLQVDIPSCAISSDGPSLRVVSHLTVHLLANLTSRYPADVTVEAGSQDFNVTLATLHGVTSYLVRLQTDPGWTLLSCQPGPGQPAFADCAPVHDGVIMVGAFREKQLSTSILLARISPAPADILFGYIEYYAGISSQRLPIVAGRFGSAPVPPLSISLLPVADPAMLARQYELALRHPWDQQAMRDARFTLQLLADRQRLVDARFYSNENELSVMFRVTDRFFLPDINRTSIRVLFHTRKLPPHPDAEDVPGIGVKVLARHVVDGWYAVQWVGKIPRLSLLKITYEVSTSTSQAPWEHTFSQPVSTGRPMHACPRFATDQASFLVVYKLSPAIQQQADLARRIACSTQVAPRRVTVKGLVATVGVESFIRMHQVHQALTEMVTVQANGRRLLQEEQGSIQRVGLLYINDTVDPSIPCPPGTYFTPNGTYQALPLHSIVGPDCYGMTCIEGYTMLGSVCVPATVSLDLVWVCVIVIISVILLCSCIMCALHMGKRKARAAELEAGIPATTAATTTNTSFPSSTDPFVDDDQQFNDMMFGCCSDDFYDKDTCDMDPDIDYSASQFPSSWANRCRASFQA